VVADEAALAVADAVRAVMVDLAVLELAVLREPAHLLPRQQPQQPAHLQPVVPVLAVLAVLAVAVISLRQSL